MDGLWGEGRVRVPATRGAVLTCDAAPKCAGLYADGGLRLWSGRAEGQRPDRRLRPASVALRAGHDGSVDSERALQAGQRRPDARAFPPPRTISVVSFGVFSFLLSFFPPGGSARYTD